MTTTTIQPKKNKRKYNAGTIGKHVSMAMTGSPPQDWAKFDEQFIIITDNRGERLVYQVRDQIVAPVAWSAVDAAILNYLTHTIPFTKGWELDTAPATRLIKETRTYWSLFAQPVDPQTILPVAFATDHTLAYHRVDFDPVPIEPGFDLANAAPCVGEFMSRTSNSIAFMTWIGAIFDQRAPRQQYLWLHGRGNDGKGTLMNKIRRLLGPAFSSEQPPSHTDKFWTSGIVGKRLVVFPDVNNIDFVTSGLFKSLTGGDPIRVEYKGGAIVTLDLNVLYMIISNEMPNVSESVADMRRIIFCRSASPTRHFERYEERMWTEMPIFISYCWSLYQAHLKARPNEPIPTVSSEVKEIARRNQESMVTIMDYHFAVSSNADVLECVTATRVEEILRHYWGFDRKEISKARKYLYEELGAKSEPRWIDRRSVRLYVGLWERGVSNWID